MTSNQGCSGLTETYSIRRICGPLHDNFPFVDVRLIGQGYSDTRWRRVEKLAQFLEMRISEKLVKQSVQDVQTLVTRFWLPWAVILSRTCGGILGGRDW